MDGIALNMIGTTKTDRKVYKDHLYAGAVNGCLIIPAFLIRHVMHYKTLHQSQQAPHKLYFTGVKAKQPRFANVNLFAHTHEFATPKDQRPSIASLLKQSSPDNRHTSLSLTPFDLSVLGAITAIFVAHQLRRAVITTLQLIETLGLEPTGDNYKRVRKAISNVGNIGFQSTDSGFLPEQRLCFISGTEDINGHKIQFSANYLTLLNRSATAIVQADQLIALRRSRNTAAQLLFLYFASSESSVIKYKVATLAKRFGYATAYGEHTIAAALTLLSALKFLTRSIIEKVTRKGWSLDQQNNGATFRKGQKLDIQISYRDIWNYASRFYIPWNSMNRAFRDLHPRKTALVLTS